MILLNGTEVKPTIFPDKTSQVWHLNIQHSSLNNCEVTWNFESEAEFIWLAQLKHLLNVYYPTVTLDMDYLPYARQDKTIANENTFALRSFADLLNSLEFDEVRVLDPHSAVAEGQINNFTAWYPIEAVTSACDEMGATLVCYPDDGAQEKYESIYDLKYIHGEKVRDQARAQSHPTSLWEIHRVRRSYC
jgi:ribose-phosphate pyrophosphokinase